MKRLEVSGAVRSLYGSLGVKGLRKAMTSVTTALQWSSLSTRPTIFQGVSQSAEGCFHSAWRVFVEGTGSMWTLHDTFMQWQEFHFHHLYTPTALFISFAGRQILNTSRHIKATERSPVDQIYLFRIFHLPCALYYSTFSASSRYVLFAKNIHNDSHVIKLASDKQFGLVYISLQGIKKQAVSAKPQASTFQLCLAILQRSVVPQRLENKLDTILIVEFNSEFKYVKISEYK